MTQRLAGKIALVTGGARGLGAAISRRFAAEGARVLIGDLAEADGRALATEIGAAASFMRHDVTLEESWATTMSAVEALADRLDILVNNAGLALALRSIDQREADDWDRIMAINLRGTFLGTKYAIPLMRRQGGGVIINMSSIAGVAQSQAMDAAYAASKAGVAMLTRTTAAQHAAEGIRCNSIHPGPIESEKALRTYADPEAFAERVSRIPLGRFGRLEDVASAAVYLASDESAYTTGAALMIDGGASVQ